MIPKDMKLAIRILDKLNDEEIELLKLRHSGKSLRDIGEILNTPYRNIGYKLEKIKKTRKSLEEADDGTFVPLGRDGKQFSFDQDSPVEIEFYALSAKNDTVESITESIGL